ncbi:methyltransferase domain-containing protein [bacterium]|nr:methyltransferase domain-containing protein [bacterium]
MTPSTYYSHERPQMRRYIPREARRLLDVGCGGGGFAAGLRGEREPAGQRLEIWGLELDPDAADHAREHLDEVRCGDALELVDGLPDDHFDCVVMNDILEHMAEPEALLRAVRRVLAPGGRLVASIPNVRHFPHLYDLVVRGAWEYGDEGILDRTHLRFFTRTSIQGMFARCGYRLLRQDGINPTGAWRWRLFDLLTLGRARDMRFLQFACVAEPGGRERS